MLKEHLDQGSDTVRIRVGKAEAGDDCSAVELATLQEAVQHGRGAVAPQDPSGQSGEGVLSDVVIAVTGEGEEHELIGRRCCRREEVC